MLKFLAKTISVVLHPLFLSFYATLLAVLLMPYQFAGINIEGGVKIYLLVFINTIFLPLIFLFLLKKLDFINSFYLRTNKERIIPFIGVSVFYTWAFISVKNTDLPPIIYQILLGATISLYTLFFINMFVKASMHSTGMGAFLILMLHLLLVSPFNILLLFCLCVLCIGLLGSARLYLGEHKPFDIYFGYIIGMISQIIAFKF